MASAAACDSMRSGCSKAKAEKGAVKVPGPSPLARGVHEFLVHRLGSVGYFGADVRSR